MQCDGDGKSFDAVCREEVYGLNFVIEEEDSVNHVSRGMGTALRNNYCRSKGPGVTNLRKKKANTPKDLENT